MMKGRFKVMAYTALAAVVLNSNAHAINSAEKPVYFGVDHEHSYCSMKSLYKHYFKNNYPGANIFLGWRALENFSFELGYSSTGTKGKYNFVANTTYVPGTGVEVASVGQNSHIRTKAKLQNTHFDVNGYMSLGDRVESIVAVGIGLFKPKIKTEVVGPTNVVNTFNLKGKTKAIPRLAFGMDGKISKNFGLRAMVRYQYLKPAKIRANGSYLGNEVFRHSLAGSLSAYYSFS